MDNPDKTKPSDTPQKADLWKTKRKEILLGSAIAIGLVFLGDGVTGPMAAAIAVATAGVMLMSWPKRSAEAAPMEWR